MSDLSLVAIKGDLDAIHALVRDQAADVNQQDEVGSRISLLINNCFVFYLRWTLVNFPHSSHIQR